MKIAIAGLGKMGGQIAQKLVADGHHVIGYDPATNLVAAAQKNGVTPAYDEATVVDFFEDEPVVVWLMVPAPIIDSVLDGWLSRLPQNSIVIDGGNSDYRGDGDRSKRAAAHSIALLDIGTSGGVWGMQNGFSMMVGGPEAAFQTVEPVLTTLAHPHGGYRHFGDNGAGHYVKMVHNAIEYGMMQSLAEGYRMLKEGPFADLDLAQAGDVWQESSVVTSWLNDLTRQALHENPELDGIDGVVAESGETRWTLETAQDLGIPLPAIEAAFAVRLASQKDDAKQNGDINFGTKLLAAMRHKFGGHNIDGRQ